ncbi:MAG: hypothetical protein J7L66_00850 [Anaerolineaceae bacterium]|nr:hypothetical protein [Anaerolineaceae bacterium]
MKKKITAVFVLFAFLMSGCGAVAKFEEAKDAYLEKRVAEMLVEDAEAETPAVEETVSEPDDEIAVEETEVEETEEKAAEEIEEETTATVIEADSIVEETEEPDANEATEETEEPQPEPTVASDDPGVYLGDADWVDEMETGEYWPTGTDEYLSAEYENGTLKIVALTDIDGWRLANQPVLKNAYIEIVAAVGDCSKRDEYGLYFRVPENVNFRQGYKFGITCDGQYFMKKWDGLSEKTDWLQYYTASEWVNKGKNQTNRIGVMAVDDLLTLFVNGKMIAQVTDDSYGAGFFGIYINRDKTENLTVTVDKVSYWLDPEAE